MRSLFKSYFSPINILLMCELLSVSVCKRCGFGLLMYGFGSKKALLEDFASTTLTDCSVIVINGYLQSINLKQV